MKSYAYLRVSKDELVSDNQKTTIINAGFNIDEFFAEEGVSGSTVAMNRPEFSKMLAKMVKGDRIVVTMIDRLGRSASDVLNTIEELSKRGVSVVVMQFGGVDVTSATGKLIVTVMAACAELELNNLKERTKMGMQRTKEQGTKLGRPFKISPEDLEGIVAEKQQGLSVDQISIRRKLPVATVYQNIKKWGNDLEGYRKEYVGRMEQYALKQSILKA